MLTLKTYAHANPEEEMDLSFADFEVRDGPERLYPAPTSATDNKHKSAPDLTGRGRSRFLEHETGLELLGSFASSPPRWQRGGGVRSNAYLQLLPQKAKVAVMP